MFVFKERNGVKFLTIEEFEATGLVKHCFSTRIGGVSTGEAASLNFGFSRKDTKENVIENFKIISDVVGVDFESLVLTDQVHGSTVREVTPADRGKGLTVESDISQVDAFVTNCAGVTLVTFHADCIPVFFLDPVKKAIGLAHSGWKGTYENISKNVVEKMKTLYGTNPKDLICAVGPSIMTCHFEVGDDVADMFGKCYGKEFIKQYDKPHIDLTAIVEKQLRSCGVESIVQSEICTYCQRDVFYSYRGDDHKTGSLIAMMCLTNEEG